MPFDHFDLIACFYNRTAKFSASSKLIDLLGLSPDGLLLDAGGGTGRVGEAFHGLVREVVVADLSLGMLRYASHKGLATVCSQTEQLPFASGAFNQIIMVDAFHHVFNQHKTADELLRVIAPGGKIVIVEPDIHKFVVKLLAIGEKLLLMRSHFLPSEKIASLFMDRYSLARVLPDEFNVWVFAEKVREM